jgi:hypothetical protein
MANAHECDITQIIHGSYWLLPKVHKRFFKDCNPNHFFVKEGTEI